LFDIGRFGDNRFDPVSNIIDHELRAYVSPDVALRPTPDEKASECIDHVAWVQLPPDRNRQAFAAKGDARGLVTSGNCL